MTYAIYVALLVSVGVPLATRLVLATWLADHLRPGAAAALMAGWALVLAVCTTIALALLVSAGVVFWPSPGTAVSTTAETAPVIRAVLGGLAAAASILVVARVTVAVVRLARQYRDAAAAVPADAVAGEPVVVPGAVVPARSLPVRGGHILVGDASWRGLTPAEQAAVLAHERAHLRRRHHLHLAALTLAAAANPLVHRLRPVLEYALERDADEHAALTTGARRAVAHTIAALALATPTGGTEITPGIAGSLVVPRVQVLLGTETAPQDRCGVGVGLAIVLVVVGVLVATAHAAVELYSIATGGPC